MEIYLPPAFFLTGLVTEMARRNPHHSFVYLVSGHSQLIADLPSNLSVHYSNSIFSKWLGKRFWYRYILKKELRALKGDLFVTADNMFIKNSPIPVCLFLIHFTEIFQHTKALQKHDRITRRLVKAVQNAATIITFSDYERQIVLTQSPDAGIKLKTLMPATGEIPALKWTEKEIVKVEFAGGMEYFLFAGDLDDRFNLIDLLKAFSLFKKWQQSNMQLLIVGSKAGYTEKFSQLLSSYRHRKEVKLIINPSKETVQKIIAGAYAFVYPAIYDHFPVNILQAMESGVPVISTRLKVCEEWCGDTAMYPETADAEGFARSMQLIYKNERVRSDLIEAAKKHLSNPEKNDPAKICMNFFEESIAK